MRNEQIMASVALAVLWGTGSPAHAGPPLVTDDPNTVGPGVVQPIFAVRTFAKGTETLLAGPVMDLTVGLVDSLDATLITSFISLHDATTSPTWEFGGLIAPGVKWQFFRRPRGSLCFSPAFVFETIVIKQPSGLLSMQGEMIVGDKTTLGFDAGYVPVRNAGDTWFVGVYLNQPATGRLNVLGEVWVDSLTRSASTDFGISVGIDYGIDGDRIRLIADVGTGLASIAGPRIDFRAYLGTQLTLGTRRDRWRALGNQPPWADRK